jgi:phosphoribosylformylglycinamidine synthase
MILEDPRGVVPRIDEAAPSRYNRFHDAITKGLVKSAHDCAEGGLGVSIAEMCIGGRLGADITMLPTPDSVIGWFSESTGRIVVEVEPKDLREFQDTMGESVLVIGTVISDPTLKLLNDGSVAIADLLAAWQS